MTDTEMRQAFAAILMNQAILLRMMSGMWTVTSVENISAYTEAINELADQILDAGDGKT